MSHDEPTNRKEKKAQRDAERQRKGKKRKHNETADEAEDAQPQADLEKDFVPLAAGDGVVGEESTETKKPKSKKRKQREEATEDAPGQASSEQAEAGAEDGTTKPKPKKRKKAKVATEGVEGEQEATATDKPTKSRFIVFVGNLPYDTTDASLQAHFKKLMPFTLRHRTDPKIKKSKGFAFLEFENYDRMKTCLKLYHHSMFDPEEYRGETGEAQGKGKKRGARQINVELTAGGGGKGDARKQKLTEKNVRLEEQRKRRAEAELKEKAAAEKKAAKGGKRQGTGKEEGEKAAEEASTAGIHPSRLAMMKG